MDNLDFIVCRAKLNISICYLVQLENSNWANIFLASRVVLMPHPNMCKPLSNHYPFFNYNNREQAMKIWAIQNHYHKSLLMIALIDVYCGHGCDGSCCDTIRNYYYPIPPLCFLQMWINTNIFLTKLSNPLHHLKIEKQTQNLE